MSERTTITADGADENGIVTGYMCLIDWQHELGCASDGNKIYPSLDALKRAHPMWDECGIVRVEVRAVDVEAKQKLGRSPVATPKDDGAKVREG